MAFRCDNGVGHKTSLITPVVPQRVRLRCNAAALIGTSAKIQGVSVGSREMFDAMCRAMTLHQIRPVIDVVIGSVKSVAQIGAPRALASLRQRLGRTGRRRGTPSVLRIYLREPNIHQKSGFLDRLRPNTIRSVAIVRLLLQGFVEEAGSPKEIASTLVHQILSVITQRGGIRPKPLFDLLCGPGPFSSIQTSDFATLLRHLATEDVRFLEQASDGTLMLGPEGEKVVQSRSFFAVFEAGEEWRLTVGSRTLGTLPITHPVHKDGLVVFAGQRWIIRDLDEKTMTLFVAPHPGGVVPRFEPSEGEPAHDRLIAEMRSVYAARDIPPYLDAIAQEMLEQGRETFRMLGLESRSLLPEEKHMHVFLWRGSEMCAVFSAALAMAGLKSGVHHLGVSVSDIDEKELKPILHSMSQMLAMDPADVADFVSNVKVGKFREQVPDQLARALWARRNASSVATVAEAARKVLV